MGYQALRTSSLIRVLREEFEAVIDGRKGPNKRYEIVDVALSAFAVFFAQSPSFLAYQWSLIFPSLQSRKQSNLELLGGRFLANGDGRSRRAALWCACREYHTAKH